MVLASFPGFEVELLKELQAAFKQLVHCLLFSQILVNVAAWITLDFSSHKNSELLLRAFI